MPSGIKRSLYIHELTRNTEVLRHQSTSSSNGDSSGNNLFELRRPTPASASGLPYQLTQRQQQESQVCKKRKFDDMLTEGNEDVHNSNSRQNDQWDEVQEQSESCNDFSQPPAKSIMKKLTETVIEPISKKWLSEGTSSESLPVPPIIEVTRQFQSATIAKKSSLSMQKAAKSA